jgi:acetoin utilization deacetylase AcuC-like enzyme
VSGFCIFNNLAVTARFAARHHGFERILIVDWDVHHGHGLNDLFYREPGVFYFSTHDTLLYPHSGDWTDAGEGEGRGYTVNIPLPRELEDQDVVDLYRGVLPPLVRRYAPQLILVAAGFDGHRDDPVGRSRLTEAAFGELTRLLLAVRREAGGAPLLLALEGGYDPPSLARSVREVLLALNGEEPKGLPDREPTPRAQELLGQALEVHRPYGVWTE